METKTREIPKCFYDVRTVLVPRSVTEDFTVMENRFVAITIPVMMQKAKWISVPREISIPRPMVEKRLVTKTVPKVIQVEEAYEVEVGLTETETYEVPTQQTVQVEQVVEETYLETVEIETPQVKLMCCFLQPVIVKVGRQHPVLMSCTCVSTVILQTYATPITSNSLSHLFFIVSSLHL